LNGNKSFVNIEFNDELDDSVTNLLFMNDIYNELNNTNKHYDQLKQDEISFEKLICSNFMKYGFCNDEKCSKSLHSVDIIIKLEVIKMNLKIKKKELKKGIQNENKKNDESMITQIIDRKTTKVNSVHTAGIDAFMTGYVMLSFMNKLIKNETNQIDNLISSASCLQWINNIYLMGKEYPLKISKSNFSSISINHKEKKQRLVLNSNIK
jgi:hypothetical protein